MCKFKFDLLVIYLEFYLINFLQFYFFFSAKNLGKIWKNRKNQRKWGNSILISWWFFKNLIQLILIWMDFYTDKKLYYNSKKYN